MTLELVPPGKGNWAPMFVTIKGRHFAPLTDVRAGMFLTLGSQLWRIRKVMP